MKNKCKIILDKLKHLKKRTIALLIVLFVIAVIAIKVLTAQFYYSESGYVPVETEEA